MPGKDKNRYICLLRCLADKTQVLAKRKVKAFNNFYNSLLPHLLSPSAVYTAGVLVLLSWLCSQSSVVCSVQVTPDIMPNPAQRGDKTVWVLFIGNIDSQPTVRFRSHCFPLLQSAPLFCYKCSKSVEMSKMHHKNQWTLAAHYIHMAKTLSRSKSSEHEHKCKCALFSVLSVCFDAFLLTYWNISC